MLKEIFEQPRAVAQTLEERVAGGKLLEAAFGPAATAVFARTEAVRIVACGTSFHAGMVAKYFIEQICRIAVLGRDRERVPLSQPGRAAATRCSSACRSPARPRTRWRRCRLAKQAGLSRRSSRSATCPRARWCANPSS